MTDFWRTAKGSNLYLISELKGEDYINELFFLITDNLKLTFDAL